MSLEHLTQAQSLQEEWGLQDNLAGHQVMAKQVLDIIENRLVLPEDRRWQVGAAALLTAGDQRSGVRSKGPFGAMKSTFGELLFGSEARIGIVATDTDQTLFGHEHPMPNGSTPPFVPGKLAKHVDPIIKGVFVNEGAHLRNQKPLQKMWERGEMIKLGDGSHFTLDGATYYWADNDPDNIAVFPLTPSIMSRLPMEILTGDVDDARARRIQSAAEVDFTGTPLIPTVSVRQQMSGMVEAAYPDPVEADGVTLTANFTVDLINALNNTGLVMPINPSDARTGKAIRTAARAYLFDEEIRTGSRAADPEKPNPINHLVVARVASLVMPTVVKLSATAEERLTEAAGGERPLEHLERSIAARVLIAQKAFEVAEKAGAKLAAGENSSELLERMRKDNPEKFEEYLLEIAAASASKYTYADSSVLNYDVKHALATPVEQAQSNGHGSNGNGRRRFALSRRRS